MYNIPIKALSVNECRRGQRYKTPKYKQYEKLLLVLLPRLQFMEIHGIEMEVGMSNSLADIDNCLKPRLDVLQKKYPRFNDKQIEELRIKKIKVKKGMEFISFNFF